MGARSARHRDRSRLQQQPLRVSVRQLRRMRLEQRWPCRPLHRQQRHDLRQPGDDHRQHPVAGRQPQRRRHPLRQGRQALHLRRRRRHRRRRSPRQEHPRRQDPAHQPRRHPAQRQPLLQRGRLSALRRRRRRHRLRHLPGDLRLRPAQPLPHRHGPQRRWHPLLHQRRRPEHLGGDRRERLRRQLRLERPRGSLPQRPGLHSQPPHRRRLHRPDPLVRPQRRQLHHRRRLRPQRHRLAGRVHQRLSLRRLRHRHHLPPQPHQPDRHQPVHALQLRHRARLQQRHLVDLRSQLHRRHRPVLHHLCRRRRDPHGRIHRQFGPGGVFHGQPGLGPCAADGEFRRLGLHRPGAADVRLGVRRRRHRHGRDRPAHIFSTGRVHRDADRHERSGQQQHAEDHSGRHAARGHHQPADARHDVLGGPIDLDAGQRNERRIAVARCSLELGGPAASRRRKQPAEQPHAPLRQSERRVERDVHGARSRGPLRLGHELRRGAPDCDRFARPDDDRHA